ncbi:MAG TPA: hypothetical protein VJ912_01130 [Candidatus Nanoarchaeia archaeon]|nr:hypothetical protein [Candidatus Nanoarchaeia archaeon]
MNTGKIKSIYGILFLIILMGFVLSNPPFPTTPVHCLNDSNYNCHIYNKNESECCGCYVQYIKPGDDGEINPPNEMGGVSGDDIFVGTTYVDDFGFVKFIHLSIGEKIFTRVWNSKNIGTSSGYGDSNILTIQEKGSWHGFDNFSINEEYDPGFFIGCKEDYKKIENSNYSYKISPKNKDNILDYFHIKIGEFLKNIDYNVSVYNNSNKITTLKNQNNSLHNLENKKGINFSWNGKIENSYIKDGKYDLILDLRENTGKEENITLGNVEIDNTPPEINMDYNSLYVTNNSDLKLNISFSDDTYFWEIFNNISNKSFVNLEWKINETGHDIISMGDVYNITKKELLNKSNSVGYENIKICDYENNNSEENKTLKPEIINNKTIIKKVGDGKYNLTISSYDNLGNEKQKTIQIIKNPQNKIFVGLYGMDTEDTERELDIVDSLFSFDDGSLNFGLEILFNRVIDKGYLNITKYNDNPFNKDVNNKENIGKIFEISESKNIKEKMQSSFIEIRYDNDDIEDIKENSLEAYYYNEESEEWEEIDSELDTNDNEIIIQLDHFSFYGIFGEEDNSEGGEDDDGNSGSSGTTSLHSIDNRKSNVSDEENNTNKAISLNKEQTTKKNSINPDKKIPGKLFYSFVERIEHPVFVVLGILVMLIIIYFSVIKLDY